MTTTYSEIILSIANEILASKNCAYNFDCDKIIDEIRFSTNWDYMIEKINYVKNGFGFSEKTNHFCHTKSGRFCAPLEQMDKDTMYLIHFVLTDKGVSAKWFIPIDTKAGAEEVQKSLRVILDKVLDRMIQDEDKRQERLAREAAKEVAKKTTLKEMGINEYQIISERRNYCGYRMCYERIYRFEKEIDRDTFIKFLAVIGERTEAKDLHSFDPEEVNIRSCRYYSADTSAEWKYEWKQGYND